ncbi:hypothetical protein ACFBZI_08345 [Moraxella sp. ZJ142]|uniref:hypothetical protein n=1 Tax=Moraxella marmotae TaxID=3344520 RepID=UPI0035D3E108
MLKTLAKSTLVLALAASPLFAVSADAKTTKTTKTAKTVQTTQKSAAAAPAKTQADELSDEQKEILQICSVAADSVADIAFARQSDIAKAVVVKGLEEEVAEIQKHTNPEFAGMWSQFWNSAVEELYKQPIEKDDAKKLEFVSAAGHNAFAICLENFTQEPTVQK